MMENSITETENQYKFLEDIQRAILNILEDADNDKKLSENTQKALINILDDFTNEKNISENTQRAVLNILDDYSDEKTVAEATQKAVINILDDFTYEKNISENTQRAVLNILDDYTNEKTQAAETQKAVINILEDYSIEKTNVQKMNTKLTSSNEEVEQFAYIASHDLQEPLRTVTNYIELLQTEYKGKLDTDADEYLDIIKGATVRMQALIKDLLSYSRIGKEKNKTVVDCNILLREVMNDIFTSIKENKAKINFEQLPILNGYSSGLKSLFQNLISNSLKFRKSDTHPIINIVVRDEDREWLFSINDNGIGINKKYFDKLFIIFQRLHNREEYPGTGIGLAQCKKIVELHGGRIWVESEPGNGSTFYFTIPK